MIQNNWELENSVYGQEKACCNKKNKKNAYIDSKNAVFINGASNKKQKISVDGASKKKRRGIIYREKLYS